MWKNNLVRYHHDKCYYCICTACNSIYCPYKKNVNGCCTYCKDDKIKPRLDCDFFRHFRKSKQYRFEKVKYPLVTLYNCRVRGVGEYHNITLERIEKLAKWCVIEYMVPSKVVQYKSKGFKKGGNK